MAALGRETASGDFEVLDVCFAGVPPQPPRSMPPAAAAAESSPSIIDSKPDENGGSWVALISGLSVGGDEASEDIRIQMCVEWLTGEMGSEKVCVMKRDLCGYCTDS